MWTPPGWYHETCSLDEWMIGIGALSYPGADLPPKHPPRNCSAPAFMAHLDPMHVAQGAMERDAEYSVNDVGFCAFNECHELPYGKFDPLSNSA